VVLVDVPVAQPLDLDFLLVPIPVVGRELAGNRLLGGLEDVVDHHLDRAVFAQHLR
jgi:hypothetical protein